MNTHAPSTARRWWILLGAVAVQLMIGGVYAWSVMARALTDPAGMGLSKVAASVPFELAIGMIFIGSFIGGRLQDKHGPRVVAMTGVGLYAAGTLLASLARQPHDLWLLALGYGLIGGLGLGLVYIVPIALLQKWFPERAALATGLAVGGFGFGAVLTAPLAQRLIAVTPEAPTNAFLPLGLLYLVVGLLGAATFMNPPATTSTDAASGLNVKQALSTPQWYLLTATLTLSVMAGISLISVAASVFVDTSGMSPAAAAAAVGTLGLLNGAGRIFWAWASERLGRTTTLALLVGLQGAALLALPHASSPALLLTLAGVIYLCYGGTFGVLPSTAGRLFGLAHAGAIYGLMLVGWSLGGVVGPLLVAGLAGPDANWTLAFSVIGAVAALAAAVPLLVRRFPAPSTTETAQPTRRGVGK